MNIGLIGQKFADFSLMQAKDNSSLKISLLNFVKDWAIGSLNKVEPGNLKGKPGNSSKSLNQANKLEQPHFFVYHKLKSEPDSMFKLTILVCDKLKSKAAI